MQTRTDQAQAYRFTTRRIVSALLTGEPETSERPMRRFGMGIFGSIMVATVVFAAVGIIGFLFPSGARLTDKAIVVERETGATYIFEQGVLYPVRNFTSAKLAVGGNGQAQPTRVSVKSLRGIPQGPLIGIPDLPDSLPDQSGLVKGPWSACSRPVKDGSLDHETDVVIGGARPDWTPLGDQAVIVRRSLTDEVQYFLLWRGHRLRIAENGITALGMPGVPRVEVTTGLINSIPQGPFLMPPTGYTRGGSGADIDGSPGTIGDVYEDKAASRDYVLVDTGLKQIGRVMKNLLLESGAQRHDISLAAVTAAQSRDGRPFQPAGFPEDIPKVSPLSNPQMICAVTAPVRAPSDSGMEIYLYESMGDVSLLRRTPDSGRPGPGDVQTAEYVQMVGGQAALVKASPAPGDDTSILTTYLVAQGYKFPLAAEAVKAPLGYENVVPTLVPTFMLALLPTGNVLDTETARSGISTNASPPAGITG